MADPYSDIDLLWVVPDKEFEPALALVEDALAAVQRVVSMRVDPDFARSDRRRVLFVRLEALPLFWRIDLEVRAASVADQADYDAGNPAARSEAGWSRTASALANAIGATKALIRSDIEVFDRLLGRGYERIGLAYNPASDPRGAIVTLAKACADHDHALHAIAKELCEVLEVLVPARSVARLTRASRLKTVPVRLRRLYIDAYDFHLRWWLRLAAWALTGTLLALYTPRAIVLSPLPLEASLLGASWWRRRRQPVRRGVDGARTEPPH